MNARIVYVLSCLSLILNVQLGRSEDEKGKGFKKVLGDGTGWYVLTKREVAEKVKIISQADFDPATEVWRNITEDEIPGTRTYYDLLCATQNSTNLIWRAVDQLPDGWPEMRSGFSPYHGIIVWDVMESKSAVYVLSSIHSTIYLDVQHKNADGHWENTARHELVYIGSPYVSTRLDLISDGVRVEITQGKAQEAKTDVFEITANGFQAYLSKEPIKPVEMDEGGRPLRHVTKAGRAGGFEAAPTDSSFP